MASQKRQARLCESGTCNTLFNNSNGGYVSENPQSYVLDLDHMPLSERRELFRHGLKATMGCFELDAIGDAPMYQRLAFQGFSSFTLTSLTTSAVRAKRYSECDGEPQLSFNMMTSGEVVQHRQIRREMECRPGEAMLVSLYEPYVCTAEASYSYDIVRLSRRELACRMPDVEAALCVAVPLHNPALVLLRQYVEALRALPQSAVHTLDDTVSAHIGDLVALALGAAGDERQQAKEGGAKAARYVVIKRFVDRNLLDPTMCAGTVAHRFSISERYLRLLFEPEGGFHDYVVRRRLDRAARLLADPRMAEVKIIDIAFRCGFNSISTFNRLFLQLHGVTPSQARSAAVREQ